MELEWGMARQAHTSEDGRGGNEVPGLGFEPRKPLRAPDLQSGAIVHSAIPARYICIIL